MSVAHATDVDTMRVKMCETNEREGLRQVVVVVAFGARRCSGRLLAGTEGHLSLSTTSSR